MGLVLNDVLACAASGSPGRLGVTLGDEALTFETGGGAVRVRAGGAETPDAVLTGPPELLVGVLVGTMGLDQARARGLRVDGDLTALHRLRPPSATAAVAPPVSRRAARAQTPSRD